eukprot:342984_1
MSESSWSVLFWKKNAIGGSPCNGSVTEDDLSIRSSSSTESYTVVPSPLMRDITMITQYFQSRKSFRNPGGSPRLVLHFDVVDPSTNSIVKIYPENEVLDIQQKQIGLLQRRHDEHTSRLAFLERQLTEAQRRLKRSKRDIGDLHARLRAAGLDEGLQSAAEAGSDDDVRFACGNCDETLFTKSQIISKVTTKASDACLTTGVCNVSFGPRVCRKFPSGLYTVLQLFCNGCLNPIGWKFEEAFEERQRYREGKFMVNTSNIKEVSNEWHDDNSCTFVVLTVSFNECE